MASPFPTWPRPTISCIRSIWPVGLLLACMYIYTLCHHHTMVFFFPINFLMYIFYAIFSPSLSLMSTVDGGLNLHGRGFYLALNALNFAEADRPFHHLSEQQLSEMFFMLGLQCFFSIRVPYIPYPFMVTKAGMSLCADLHRFLAFYAPSLSPSFLFSFPPSVFPYAVVLLLLLSHHLPRQVSQVEHHSSGQELPHEHSMGSRGQGGTEAV